MFDSASKKVVIDGVEYSPIDVKEVPVEPLESEEPWYSFLKSTRFWVMILGALSVYMESKGWLGESERNLIATVATVFVTVKTLDRGAEAMGK